MRNTAIFLGPSLDVAVARSILDAVYLPPVKRGDLYLLTGDICTVGIVDGEFFQSLSVSPKEVMTLLEHGMKVFGGSSMGALRAVEMSQYGMVGVGKIFEMYRDGEIDADDEVAMTYDPSTYRVTSEPLVNIRCALRAAVDLRVLEQSEADEILQVTGHRYFPDRSYLCAFERCPRFEAFVKEKRPNQKRDDAIQLLKTIAALGTDG
jgi:TfuA protein